MNDSVIADAGPGRPSTTRLTACVIVFVAAATARVVFHLLSGFVADDAFITFRYAENLAAGVGFVYNPGEHVLGTSTPLFTLILAALCALKLPVITAALAVSMVAAGTTAALVLCYARALDLGEWSLLPALAYAFWPRSLAADASGMETALFTLLVTAALLHQHHSRLTSALGLAALAAVTRPEGFGLLGLLILDDWAADRRLQIRSLLIPALIVGPWLVFATWYFGAPLPSTVAGKLALYSRFETWPLLRRLVFVLGLHNPGGPLTLLAVVCGAWWLARRHVIRREIIWIAGLIVFFILGNIVMTFWYMAPIYPIYLLLASATMPLIVERSLWVRRNLGVLRIAMIAAPLAALLIFDVRPVQTYRHTQIALEAVHKQIGLYLNRHAQPEDWVAAEDIGYMGFYSQRRILDRDGLVSPQVHPYNRRGDYAGVINDYRPEWVVGATYGITSSALRDSTFLSRYHEVTRFTGDQTEYAIYRRNE